MPKSTQTDTFYSVALHTRLAGRRLAASKFGGGPELTLFRSEAVSAKNRLRSEGFRNARVVKVKAVFTWSER